MIEDLDRLGDEKNEDFLKGFPKTPAQIEAERKAEEEKRKAQERAEEKLKIAQEEADREALKQVEKAEDMKGEGENSLSPGDRQFVSPRFFQERENIFRIVEEAIGGIITSLGLVCCLLWGAFRQEFSYVWENIAGGFKAAISFFIEKRRRFYENNPEKEKQVKAGKKAVRNRLSAMKQAILKREKKVAQKMARAITGLDRKNDEIADKTTEIVEKGNRKYNFAREWAEINKKKLLVRFSLFVFLVLVAITIFDYSTAYEYAYNGRTLGIVKSQEDVLKIVDVVSNQLSKEHNAEIYIDKDQDITFKRVISLSKVIDDTEDVLNRLTYMKNMNAKGYAIIIDGSRAAIMDSEKSAKDTLEIVKNMFVSQSVGTSYESISIKEKMEIQQVDTKLGRIQNQNQVIQKLLTGAVYQQTHTVVAGETFSGIAKAYGMTMGELREANPGITPEKLSIGQEVILSKPAPMITVQTVEVATFSAPMPFETQTSESATMYKGEKTVKTKGVQGERQVTARITRENGIQVASKELSSKIIRQPVTEVVIKGTKELPPLQGTGSLRYPVSGFRISSKFGPRWGRMHNGLDLACPTGTRIGAADGGTVIYSGYSGSYGYVVKINHGGGIVTIYAHCSKLLVKKGDRVYQGQHIANVGSTGRSTGPHCHFEVQVNGTPRNPLGYL